MPKTLYLQAFAQFSKFYLLVTINIIRISGNDSINIVDKIFDKDLTIRKSHTVTYGHIVCDKEIIDEVLISVFLILPCFPPD